MKKFAVFGNPIGFSKSPFIHQAFAEEKNIALSYEKIEPPADGFQKALTDFINDGGNGCNVSLPFKHQAFLLAHEHSDSAKVAQAANTLVINEDGTLFADNTDGTGLTQDLTHNLDFSLRQKRILILGAGGAVSGVLAPLIDQAPAELVISNRTFEKAEALAKRFELKGPMRAVDFQELEKESAFDLIIHGTSAYAKGEPLQLPEQIVDQHSCCYDLMYADQETPFMTWGKTHQAKCVVDGTGMLVEQAAAAFYIFHGVYPDTQPVIAALKS